MRFLSPLLAACALAVLPIATSAGEVIAVDPGLWKYERSMDVASKGIVDQASSEFCLGNDKHEVSASDILGLLNLDGCEVSDQKIAKGKGTANLTCVYSDQGRATGVMETTFAKTSYAIIAEMSYDGPGGKSTARFVSNGNRVGACH